MHNRPSLLSQVRFFCLVFLLSGPGVLVAPVCARPLQAAAPGAVPHLAPQARPREVPLADRLRSPYEADRPLTDKLRSPRETLQTLYFAVITYDLFPQVIQDAVACLDLDAMQPRPTLEDAGRLALDLEYILQRLALPLCNVPDQGTGNTVVLHDADGFRLALRRGPDGGWRFDADTLRQLPAMCRAAQERCRQHPPDRSAFREGLTDPRATLRQFVSDTANGDFYAAARALDLSALSDEQRRTQGPALAQQLACVQQRRAFLFRQEVPDQPDSPPYTWHADGNGRIALDRVRLPDGKDAWLFTRQTVRNIPRMYAAVQGTAPDSRYVRLGMVIPWLQAGADHAARKRPEDIPSHLGSPRALLQGFFRTMDAADANDACLIDALEYLDLEDVPPADRATLGCKLAAKLEAVLRKLAPDLGAVPDDWNAPAQILGEAHGVRIEILRQRDGCWRVSRATVARIPEMFDKLAGKVRYEPGRGAQLDSARDTVMTFQAAASRRDFTLAAGCLNLSDVHASAREEVGPVLAFKLKYVIDRIGRIYVQEVPDNPEGPRYVLYRGELGRIALDRTADGRDKGRWQFTPETVRRIEPMFRAVLGQPPDESLKDTTALAVPRFWETPGTWVRLRLPDWLQTPLGSLDLYQWLGLALAALVSWVCARVAMLAFTRLVAWLLRRSGSALSASFVAIMLRPFTWVTAVWIFYLLLGGLDLPIRVAGSVFAAHKFLQAALFGWLGVRLMDLSMAIYTNSELLRPHRNLSDMIVPVSMRLGKMIVLLVVATYMIYQIGEIDLLGRFLTGLGVAGLAASLAAQDALKSFFGTLLLIGERAFKIGDHIIVGGKEGVVEQVGFRSTRLRTVEDSLLTIPNAVIAAAPIDNMGARSLFRFSTTIEVSPDTPAEGLLKFRDRLRAWLAEQPVIVSDRVDLHIHQLTSHGVELSVNLFLATHAGGEESRFREGLICEVLRLAGLLGVEVAPTYPRLVQKDGSSPSTGTVERPARAA